MGSTCTTAHSPMDVCGLGYVPPVGHSDRPKEEMSGQPRWPAVILCSVCVCVCVCVCVSVRMYRDV